MLRFCSFNCAAKPGSIERWRLENDSPKGKQKTNGKREKKGGGGDWRSTIDRNLVPCAGEVTLSSGGSAGHVRSRGCLACLHTSRSYMPQPLCLWPSSSYPSHPFCSHYPLCHTLCVSVRTLACLPPCLPPCVGRILSAPACQLHNRPASAADWLLSPRQAARRRPPRRRRCGCTGARVLGQGLRGRSSQGNAEEGKKGNSQKGNFLD